MTSIQVKCPAFLPAMALALGWFTFSPSTSRAFPPRPQPYVALSLAHHTVASDGRQTAIIRTDPDVKVDIIVIFPNAPRIAFTRRSGPSGKLRVSFVQPRNSVTVGSRMATVEATAEPFVFPGPTVSYRIAYAPVDIATGRRAFSGDRLPIDVHASPRVPITVRLSTARGTVATFRGRTGGKGWARFSYSIPQSSGSGTLDVVASANPAGLALAGRASVALLGPFRGKLSVYDCETDIWLNGGWAYVAQVHPGDKMRFVALYTARDRGVTRYPTGVTGTVRLEQGGKVVLEAVLLPDSSSGLSNMLDAEVALPSSLPAGRVTVIFTATDGHSRAKYGTQIEVVN